MPEKVLACRHALCDVRIRVYGARSRSEKNIYTVKECILCGSCYQSSIFHFVPATAGVRVLNLDGGGVRGVIPLVLLRELEKAMSRLACPVQDYFNFVYGISAGMQFPR